MVVFSFDEMYLSNRLEFEPINEQILGPYNSVQVMSACGLFDKWKQPIFFEFDCDMSQNILITAIRKLYSIGYEVVSFVSDLGSTNRKLHKELEISTAKPYFEHSHIHNGKVFPFADVPHLLKLLRNYFLDSDFKLSDGSIINRKPIDELIIIQKTDLKPAWKINKIIMDVKGAERQNVNFAAKLLSWNTAKALLWAGDSNLISSETDYKKTSMFIELTNAWFDEHNSTHKFGHHSGVNSYGVNLPTQNQVLDKMSTVIEGIQIEKHSKMLPFQYRILLSNASLKQIYPNLQQKYNEINYLITRKFNQDLLENLFSYLRAMGNSADHPGPLDFMRHLKKYILEKHSSVVFLSNKNTEEYVTAQNLSINLLETKSYKESIKTTNIPKNVLTCNMLDTKVEEEEVYYIFEDFDNDIFIDIKKKNSSDIISKAGLRYIAGFVAHYFKVKYSYLGKSNKTFNPTAECPDWILYASKGNLTIPSTKLMYTAELMETEFDKCHGEYFYKDKNIIETVVAVCKSKGNLLIPQEVLRYMVRTRTFNLIRALNAKQTNYYTKKKKNLKKLNKVVNTVGV